MSVPTVICADLCACRRDVELALTRYDIYQIHDLDSLIQLFCVFDVFLTSGLKGLVVTSNCRASLYEEPPVDVKGSVSPATCSLRKAPITAWVCSPQLVEPN